MATFETFGREITLATQGLTGDAVAKLLAKFARAELAKVIASGAGSESYTRYVNGREGAVEESVVPPGPILYVFSNWSLIVNDALEQLVKLSPRKSGAFARSFIVIVGGKAVTDFSQIPHDAEVIITNAQPYVRKINLQSAGGTSGGRTLGVTAAPTLFERARKSLISRFGSKFVIAKVRYLDIPAGIHPQIPYILKGGMQAARLATKGGPRTRRAKGGDALTYPSLVLNMVS